MCHYVPGERKGLVPLDLCLFTTGIENAKKKIPLSAANPFAVGSATFFVCLIYRENLCFPNVQFHFLMFQNNLRLSPMENCKTFRFVIQEKRWQTRTLYLSTFSKDLRYFSHSAWLKQKRSKIYSSGENNYANCLGFVMFHFLQIPFHYNCTTSCKHNRYCQIRANCYGCQPKVF